MIARYDSPGAECTILLDAHQDTVPVDGMTIAPFEPKIADGRLWGRGACDVKGGMAAMLSAFRRLIREQPVGAANVVLSCTCDEEATITGITDLVSYWSTARGTFKASADSTGRGGHCGTDGTGRRGGSSWRDAVQNPHERKSVSQFRSDSGRECDLPNVQTGVRSCRSTLKTWFRPSRPIRCAEVRL